MRRAIRSILGWTWYPTLLALVFVSEPIARYNIQPVSGFRVLLITVVLSITVTLAANRLLGRDRGAAAACLVILGFIGATSPDRALLVALAIALLSIEAWLSARGRMTIRIPWPRVTEALNLVLAVMLVIQGARGAEVRLAAPVIAAEPGWTVPSHVAGPDMFVILADGHGRRDVLSSGFGYDEQAFADTMTSLGFVEATNSHANHVLTRFSLSVLFNGRPLSEMGQDMSAVINEDIPFAALRNPAASDMLHAAGYEFIAIGSGYEHLGLRGVDQFIDVGPRNEVEEAMLEGTALGQAVDSLTSGYFHDVRERTLHETDELKQIASQPASSPEFVFAHLPAPHWPMVLNADCSLRPTDAYTRGAYGRDWHAGDATALAVQRDQTICVDSLLADAVKSIVEARPGAVVIVLSDHGPEERLDWHTPSEPGLGDRFANLFWARTPGQPTLFPNDVTLVNVLPILFNAYLGSTLPLHANELWFGPAAGGDHFVRYEPLSTTP